MAARFSDQQIDAFVRERKPLPEDYRTRVRLREKRWHKESELEIAGANGNLFRLIFRQSGFNPLDFSIILALCPAESSQIFRLRRYNGKSHEHGNRIEGDEFYDFHVHYATERYQELGMNEDAYAMPSQGYSDFHSALDCLLSDCGFDLPPGQQLSLFEVKT